jgi:hypothetical protein
LHRSKSLCDANACIRPPDIVKLNSTVLDTLDSRDRLSRLAVTIVQEKTKQTTAMNIIDTEAINSPVSKNAQQNLCGEGMPTEFLRRPELPGRVVKGD